MDDQETEDEGRATARRVYRWLTARLLLGISLSQTPTIKAIEHDQQTEKMTVPEITTKIKERGQSGLSFAARQFDKGSRENTLLNYDLKSYQKESAQRTELPRFPEVKYSDADLCLFHLATDEDRPLVDAENDHEVPTWWLIGQDDLRDNGFVLLEFPGDEQETDHDWTRVPPSQRRLVLMGGRHCQPPISTTWTLDTPID